LSLTRLFFLIFTSSDFVCTAAQRTLYNTHFLTNAPGKLPILLPLILYKCRHYNPEPCAVSLSAAARRVIVTGGGAPIDFCRRRRRKSAAAAFGGVAVKSKACGPSFPISGEPSEATTITMGQVYSQSMRNLLFPKLHKTDDREIEILREKVDGILFYAKFHIDRCNAMSPLRGKNLRIVN